MRHIPFVVFFVLFSIGLYAQSPAYPYPVRYIHLQTEQKVVKMAYMDVNADRPNGKTVLLLHGKNFNGFYWKEIIPVLAARGYRVIVPDQVGWGMSDKPDLHYSFHLLASNTKQLLDSLGVQKVHVIGHSMGGMLASRFVLMYPMMTGKLVYENPIGLEDYKTFVPYHTVNEQFQNELKASYESMKKYQQSYYPDWKPEYEQYVAAQFEAMQTPDFEKATWASALTYQMIYEQPVIYEIQHIKQKTLIIIGQEDRTVVGKNLLPPGVAAQHGLYPQLGKMLQKKIPGSTLVELKGVGHIPHIQVPEIFIAQVLKFLD